LIALGLHKQASPSGTGGKATKMFFQGVEWTDGALA